MASILPGAFAIDSSSGGINATSGVVLRGTWRYEDCHARLVAMRFKHPAAEYHEMIRCQVQSVYQDAYSLGVSEGVELVTMINCDTVHVFSADGNPNDPHADAFTDVLHLFRCRKACQRPRGHHSGQYVPHAELGEWQGIFLQSNVTPKVSYTGIISHNAVQSRRQGN